MMMQRKFSNSNKREKRQKFLFIDWFVYGDHLYQAQTWRSQDLYQSLKPTQCKLSHKMARSNEKRICQYEKATGMEQDKQKSYAN